MTRALRRAARLVLAGTLLVVLVISLQPRSSSAQFDERFFRETGFRIDHDLIWNLYQEHGKAEGLGQPISRTFMLLGRPTQIFERQILQIAPEGHAYLVNVVDSPLFFPYQSINGSVFPYYDADLVASAPSPGTPDYDEEIITYVLTYVLDEVDGHPVRFLRTYTDPIKHDSPRIRVLWNLPIWGIPTSGPFRDPGNPRVIYQRFERGIMLYETGCRCTRVLPLGELFRAVLTGRNLPTDFEEQAPTSPFLRQYDIDTQTGPFRATQLPETDLTHAFRPSAEEPVSWAGELVTAPPPAPPAPESPPLPDPLAFPVAPTSTPVFQPAAPPAPPSVPTVVVPPTATLQAGPFTREPRAVTLATNEVGREATLVKAQEGSDARSRWYEVRYERDRHPETLGLGPSIWHHRVYVATTPEFARDIYREESQNTTFPESSDRYRGFFQLDMPRLSEEQQAIASCEEEGCSAQRYFIHIRTVMRNANVVTVVYTYGDQLYAALPDVLPNLRTIADRMRA